MPLVWDEALYNQAYSRGYNRVVRWKNDLIGLVHDKNQLAKMETSLPQFNRNNDVLIVGCGYGFFMEVMIDLGATSVWGTDISSYIHANKATEARADIAPRILDIDISDNQARNDFNAAGAGGTGPNKGRFHWVISDFVIESFNLVTELAEFTGFLDDLDSLVRTSGQIGVIHLFAGLLPDGPGGSPHDHSLGMTWIPLEDWVPYAPHHYWIDCHDWRIGGGI